MRLHGAENHGPLFREAEKPATRERANRSRRDHRPTLRLGKHISLACSTHAENAISRRVGESFEYRMENRMRTDGHHAGSITELLSPFGIHYFLLPLDHAERAWTLLARSRETSGEEMCGLRTAESAAGSIARFGRSKDRNPAKQRS